MAALTLTHSLTHSLTHLLTHSLTYSLTHLLTHLLTGLLTGLLTHSYSLTYLLTVKREIFVFFTKLLFYVQENLLLSLPFSVIQPLRHSSSVCVTLMLSVLVTIRVPSALTKRHWIHYSQYNKWSVRVWMMSFPVRLSHTLTVWSQLMIRIAYWIHSLVKTELFTYRYSV